MKKKIVAKEQKKISLKIEDETLNQEQLKMAIVRSFNEFFKYHVNYKKDFEFFYNLPDDFFNKENEVILRNYAKIYFDYQMEKIKNGNSRYFTEKDIPGFIAMYRRFIRELNLKKRLMKKLLQRNEEKMSTSETQYNADGILQS